MFISEALSDMRMQLFKDGCNGIEPQINLYEDIANNKFKLAGELMASSIAMCGPAPNFFAPWVYHFFVGGMDAVLSSIPKQISGSSSFGKMYNKVTSTSVLCFTLRKGIVDIRTAVLM